jgi:hypothetical protein
MKFKSEVQLEALNNATVDTDKFLVSDSTTVKYRTGTQVLSDLGVSGIYVPYTGATGNVNLGTHTLLAKDLIINHSSGSGVAASITKNGSGEALTVIKGSGSGNAMSVTGGLTSLVNLSLSTVANATGDFLTHSGSTIHKRTPEQVLSDIGGQAALTNPITGTGTTNYVSKFTGSTTLGDSQIFDNGTNVGIGTTTDFGVKLAVSGNMHVTNSDARIRGGDTSGRVILSNSDTTAYVSINGSSNATPNNIGIITNSAITFNTGGSYSESMRIASNGNVGIGTQSPTFVTTGTTTLDVNGSTGAAIYLRANIAQGSYLRQTSNNLVIGNNTYGDIIYNTGFSEAMRVTADRLVGIGTQNPSALLSLQTFNNYAAIFNTGNIPSSNTAIGIGGYTTSLGTSGGTIRVYHNHGSTLASQMAFEVNGQEEKMRINSSGNVGIGTQNPSSKLSLFDSSDLWINISRGSSFVNIGVDATGTFYNTNSNHRFLYNDGINEAMRITSAGNVGIGTATPGNLLNTFIANGAGGFGKGVRISTGDGTYTSGHGGMLEFQNEDVMTAGIRGVRQSGWGSSLLFYVHNTSAGNTFDSTFVERMRINENGNVGIGTTTPSAKLDVRGDSGTSLRISSNDNYHIGALSWEDGTITLAAGGYGSPDLRFSTAGSEKMRITNAGNVGIGTNSPIRPLDVSADSGANAINIRTRSANDYGVLSFSNSTASEIISNIYIHRTGTNIGALIFETNNGGAAAERMRINSSGNVGIGTTSPSGILHVNAGASADTNVRIQAGASGNHAKLTFSNSSNTVFWTAGYRSSTGDFGINYGDSFNSTGLTINTSGNVGIGTALPTQKLEINDGNIQVNRSYPFLALKASGWSSNSFIQVGTNLTIDDGGDYMTIRNPSGKGIAFQRGGVTDMIINPSGNVGIGTQSPNASAILDLRSRTQGFLPPVMKTGDRDNISSPAEGLMIFNRDEEVVQVFTNGGGWRTLAWA